MRTRSVVLAVIALILSGCAERPAPSAAETVPVEPSSGLGRLEGIVHDSEFTPLPGARIDVSNHETAVFTDSRGAFRIDGVVPGPHLIEASLAGYRGTSQRVDVAAGEILSMRLELEAVPKIVAYHELVQFTGHMTIGLSTPLYAFRPGTEADDELEFSREAGAAMASVTGLVFTRTSSAGAEKFQLDTILDGLLYDQAYGASPVLSRVEAVPNGTKQVTLSIWLPRTCDYYVLASCYADPPSSLFQFALDQRFDVYNTLFYGAAAPADYTGLPP